MKRAVLGISAAAVLAVAATALFSEQVSGRLELLLLGNPIEGSSASIAQGRAVYLENCASCHGVDGDGRGELATDLDTQPANFYGLNRPPSVLAMRIHYGAGEDMPAWRGTLEDESIWHIVNYLSTLAQNGQGRGGDRWWRPGNS